MSHYNEENREHGYNRPDIHLQPSTTSTFLTYTVGAGSHPGQRERNEDSFFAARSANHTSPLPWSYGLFVVADGQGAYTDGQEASCCAIQAIADWIWPRIAKDNILPREICSSLLTNAVQRANEVVRQQNVHLQENAGAAGSDMGVLTTLTVVMIVSSTAYIANVGTCRAYLYRPGEGLKQITTDHSVVARLVREGILTPENMYTHVHRYVFERALFGQPLVEVDLFTVSLRKNDTFLLCSPGLWHKVRDPEIEAILSPSPMPYDPSHTAELLIQATLDGGGKDNMSAIVVSMEEKQNQMVVSGAELFAEPDSLHLPEIR